MFKLIKFIAIPLSIGITGLTVNSTVLANKESYSGKNKIHIADSATASSSAKTTLNQQNNLLGQIDLNSVHKGLIKVKFNHSSDTKIKVEIKKDSKSYMYDLISTNSYESFPLQLGSGEYKVTLFKNISGTSYSALNNWTFDAQIDSNLVFLNSIQSINWDNTMDSIKLAKELTSSCSSNDEKVQVIYNYIINNIRYDHNKGDLPSSYIPDIDDTLNSKKGICFDFSSLFASMLRSVGVQTKLVMGHTPNVNGYHAWNEVYLDKTGDFAIIDTSYDSQVKNSKANLDMVKKQNLYSKEKEF